MRLFFWDFDDINDIERFALEYLENGLCSWSIYSHSSSLSIV